jgi:hypothetical protein
MTSNRKIELELVLELANPFFPYNSRFHRKLSPRSQND